MIDYLMFYSLIDDYKLYGLIDDYKLNRSDKFLYSKLRYEHEI